MGVNVGLFFGFSYYISLSNAWELYPSSRALVTGFCYAANSLGPFIFAPLIRYLANP